MGGYGDGMTELIEKYVDCGADDRLRRPNLTYHKAWSPYAGRTVVVVGDSILITRQTRRRSYVLY